MKIKLFTGIVSISFAKGKGITCKCLWGWDAPAKEPTLKNPKPSISFSIFHKAEKSCKFSKLFCDSNWRVMINKWLSTTLNLFKIATWESLISPTKSSSS